MNEHTSQIFQSQNASRWRRFKWAGRVFLFLIAIAAIIFGIAYVRTSQASPDIPFAGTAMKKFLTTNVPGFRESKLGRQYRGFRQFMEDKWAKQRHYDSYDKPHIANAYFNDSVGIRAAFYVAWDAQSYFSLERNISKINLVLPEWFFLDEKADTLRVNIDPKALRLIQYSNVRIMPMLTNNINSIWRGDVVHRIINDPKKRERLINDLVTALKANRFTGINIDFEELVEQRNEALTSFQRDLYERLHANNLLVSQDVSPFNEDYDYPSLALYNDYLFLMAYDEHNAGSDPGSISAQKWVEAAVDLVAHDVPSEKIVLGLGAYGYDWGAGKVETVTYMEALSTARESEGNVVFDSDTYNLSFDYYDSKDSLHHVYFTDAATCFNIMRFATEYGLAGSAVWRLGSEDSRIWEFYNKPLTKDAVKKFNFTEFRKVHGANSVDYIGEGEVLDVVSTPTDGLISTELDTSAMVISQEKYESLPSVYVVRKFGKSSGKKLVLTFDDGPDPVYTAQILDTLGKYHVPAVFFLVGLEAENNIPLVKRIAREGHEIGNHTFTHPNMAEVSTKRAFVEMDLTRLLIECITGHSTILFRAPFNADSEPGKAEELIPVALSRQHNYVTVGESIDPEDWEKGIRPDFNADTIFNRTVRAYDYHVKQLEDSANIILLHDAGGDRSETVKATGMIIRYFRAKGYTFTTVADLLHKKKDELMPPVPKGSGYYLLQFNMALFLIGYYLSHIFETLFIFFMIVSAVRLSVLGYLAIKRRTQEKHAVWKVFDPASAPRVSIIVPAYNEEVNAVSSLQNLLRCDYPNFDIVFVDDGSRDSTFEKVSHAFSQHPLVQVLTKENGGKASALDYGIRTTSADYVVCIDADTKLHPDAVSKLMRHFLQTENGGKIGAVAGNVKVGNEVNIITRWQSIEYITSQNFDRRAFATINAITVVPGAIGAFRKEAIEVAGGFTTDTLAEDCDLTFRILKAGYIVTDEAAAIAMTEAPETVKQFMKQRFRWSFGVMQTFWKHRDAFFSNKYKGLGWIALPDMLLFKYIIPFFSPVADLLMFIGLLTGNAARIGKFYLLFIFIDAAIAAVAFMFEKEKQYKLIWLIPQRLIYRWLMLIVLYRSIRRAIKGELQLWGVLKRTGNVKDVAVAQ